MFVLHFICEIDPLGKMTSFLLQIFTEARSSFCCCLVLIKLIKAPTSEDFKVETEFDKIFFKILFSSLSRPLVMTDFHVAPQM